MPNSGSRPNTPDCPAPTTPDIKAAARAAFLFIKFALRSTSRPHIFLREEDLVMFRAEGKDDPSFGILDGVGRVWIDCEAEQLIVGDRDYDLRQLSDDQLHRLEAMAHAATTRGGANDAVRRDVGILIAELRNTLTH
jgi:hypothetical protein